jgi:hypothetical protein
MSSSWVLSLQREVKGWVFEGRYVGNHAVKIFRAKEVSRTGKDRKNGAYEGRQD